jgi:alkylation response protein AidB-like acyl-CoA dehydrogenase
VDLAFSPAEEAFRAELRAWLAANVPPGWASGEEREFASLAKEVAFLRDWQRKLHAGGWVGLHWPREYGGRGASVVENYVFQEELAAARAPEVINRIGVNLVGPTLVTHGTEEQKRRFLPEILPAAEVWCQLFSEPSAGSTSPRCTRAEPRGGTAGRERPEGVDEPRAVRALGDPAGAHRPRGESKASASSSATCRRPA